MSRRNYLTETKQENISSQKYRKRKRDKEEKNYREKIELCRNAKEGKFFFESFFVELCLTKFNLQFDHELVTELVKFVNLEEFKKS